MNKVMKVVIIVLSVIVLLVVALYVAGLLLPEYRVASHTSRFNAPPEVVFNVVTDNVNWQYRHDIKDLKIVSIDGHQQVWDEYGKDGGVVRFTTMDYKPYTAYAFSMSSKMFEGYWTSTYEPDGNGGTLYTATEHIAMKNPMAKVLNRLFFNLDKYLKNSQDDLRAKLDELHANRQQ